MPPTLETETLEAFSDAKSVALSAQEDVGHFLKSLIAAGGSILWELAALKQAFTGDQPDAGIDPNASGELMEGLARPGEIRDEDLSRIAMGLVRFFDAVTREIIGVRINVPTLWAGGPHASTHEVGGADLVDHDDLTNFVAEEHVDHSAVSISPGTGLSGGGTIEATRTLSIDGTVMQTSDSVADLADVDDTDVALNDVLKWNGSAWVPGTAGDTTEFTFSIDSFSDGISDTLQLCGSGTWKAIGAITFTATYSNAPDGMTAEVAMSGSSVAWSGNLSMTPVEGPETNTEAVAYPSSATGAITFTLSQSADASTDEESISFSNTLRYGNSTLTVGNQTEASLEALTERSGPDEGTNNETISNIATTANYLVFAWPARKTDIAQVRRDSGNGYVTACFAAAATDMVDVQSGIANVDNSAGFSETFDCCTSKETGLADGSNDFRIYTSATAQNYIRGGGNTESTPGNYTEADIETGLTDAWVDATNDHTQTWPTVTLLASEHYVIAIPSRLGTPTFYDDDTGFEASFQSPATLAITNDAGYQEDYSIFVSTNPLGPGDFNLRTE